jgi:hypothetical protein
VTRRQWSTVQYAPLVRAHISYAAPETTTCPRAPGGASKIRAPAAQVVGTLSVGCSSKHQSACCTTNAATQAYADCKWVETSGLCSKSGSHVGCLSDYPKFIVASSAGAGGEQEGAKSYSCKGPAPSQWSDCAWYTQATSSVTNIAYWFVFFHSASLYDIN